MSQDPSFALYPATNSFHPVSFFTHYATIIFDYLSHPSSPQTLFEHHRYQALLQHFQTVWGRPALTWKAIIDLYVHIKGEAAEQNKNDRQRLANSITRMGLYLEPLFGYVLYTFQQTQQGLQEPGDELTSIPRQFIVNMGFPIIILDNTGNILYQNTEAQPHGSLRLTQKGYVKIVINDDTVNFKEIESYCNIPGHYTGRDSRLAEYYSSRCNPSNRLQQVQTILEYRFPGSVEDSLHFFENRIWQDLQAKHQKDNYAGLLAGALIWVSDKIELTQPPLSPGYQAALRAGVVKKVIDFFGNSRRLPFEPSHIQQNCGLDGITFCLGLMLRIQPEQFDQVIAPRLGKLLKFANIDIETFKLILKDIPKNGVGLISALLREFVLAYFPIRSDRPDLQEQGVEFNAPIDARVILKMLRAFFGEVVLYHGQPDGYYMTHTAEEYRRFLPDGFQNGENISGVTFDLYLRASSGEFMIQALFQDPASVLFAQGQTFTIETQKLRRELEELGKPYYRGLTKNSDQTARQREQFQEELRGAIKQELENYTQTLRQTRALAVPSVSAQRKPIFFTIYNTEKAVLEVAAKVLILLLNSDQNLQKSISSPFLAQLNPEAQSSQSPTWTPETLKDPQNLDALQTALEAYFENNLALFARNKFKSSITLLHLLNAIFPGTTAFIENKIENPIFPFVIFYDSKSSEFCLLFPHETPDEEINRICRPIQALSPPLMDVAPNLPAAAASSAAASSACPAEIRPDPDETEKLLQEQIAFQKERQEKFAAQQAEAERQRALLLLEQQRLAEQRAAEALRREQEAHQKAEEDRRAAEAAAVEHQRQILRRIEEEKRQAEALRRQLEAQQQQALQEQQLRAAHQNSFDSTVLYVLQTPNAISTLEDLRNFQATLTSFSSNPPANTQHIDLRNYPAWIAQIIAHEEKFEREVLPASVNVSENDLARKIKTLKILLDWKQNQQQFAWATFFQSPGLARLPRIEENLINQINEDFRTQIINRVYASLDEIVPCFAQIPQEFNDLNLQSSQYSGARTLEDLQKFRGIIFSQIGQLRACSDFSKESQLYSEIPQLISLLSPDALPICRVPQNTTQAELLQCVKQLPSPQKNVFITRMLENFFRGFQAAAIGNESEPLFSEIRELFSPGVGLTLEAMCQLMELDLENLRGSQVRALVAITSGLSLETCAAAPKQLSQAIDNALPIQLHYEIRSLREKDFYCRTGLNFNLHLQCIQFVFKEKRPATTLNEFDRRNIQTQDLEVTDGCKDYECQNLKNTYRVRFNKPAFVKFLQASYPLQGESIANTLWELLNQNHAGKWLDATEGGSPAFQNLLKNLLLPLMGNKNPEKMLLALVGEARAQMAEHYPGESVKLGELEGTLNSGKQILASTSMFRSANFSAASTSGAAASSAAASSSRQP